MSGPSGRKSREPFAFYDRDSSCWRTSAALLPLENLPEPSVTWPALGTWDRGGAYALPTSERPTDANGCSSLLPTPTASERDRTPEEALRRHLPGRAMGRNGGAAPDLSSVVALLPTPRATDGEKGGPNQRGSSGDLMLPSAVTQLLPTPQARDGDGRGVPGPKWEAQPGRPLDETILTRLLPTPTVHGNHNRSDAGTKSGDGLATTATRRIGGPTGQPSDGGNTPSADPRQLPLWSAAAVDDSSAPGSWSG